MLALAFWIRVVLNQYQTIMDFQMVLIGLALCWRTLVRHIGSGVLILLSILLTFASVSTALFWCTWIWRYSGNANFFYFQTIVWNLANVFLFINIFTAGNKKVAAWMTKASSDGFVLKEKND